MNASGVAGRGRFTAAVGGPPLDRALHARTPRKTRRTRRTADGAARLLELPCKEPEPNRALFPASDDLRRFLSTLADEGKRCGTIENYKHGVNAAQRGSGYRAKPMGDRLRLRFTLRGIERTIGDPAPSSR